MGTCNCCGYSPVCCKQDKYGVFTFLWDLFWLAMTCGLWAIWIFCREMRRRGRRC